MRSDRRRAFGLGPPLTLFMACAVGVGGFRRLEAEDGKADAIVRDAGGGAATIGTEEQYVHARSEVMGSVH